ncbi:HECT E3 ubiquitin ligase, putative [Phytophthora infestans T30-4]|uniref:HECT E3 ubiquitin ligase, putative n=1 Tax=Phytophthora infestans (strain T30-4) TaxID=403677 RepID=D0MSV7_PHYIT|nr:HECT E3 ubiquitin ligase, putative [Phytophthora infestans T30-4]EEY57541.1 HECT E3 ubiquitin ligase, putative [Phytophthora infestans T30-4]|eukprot:XP_002908727.1 HECT E3 ubiquitin ligase, putative [Phytophthora infestans T30-4]
MATVLHQTRSVPVLIPFEQWFKLLDYLQKLSIDEVFSMSIRYLIQHDASFVASAFEFCLEELETAAAGKAYEAVLWTQRELHRPDQIVLEEPGIELVIWLLDALLAASTHSSLCLSVDGAKIILRRLRRCLGTTNLPLKFVILRTISRVLRAIENVDKDMVNEAQLVVQDFLTAAVVRHSRELSQGRLLFSQYLQGYVELLHVLQGVTGFNVAPTPAAHMVASSSGDALESEGCLLLFDRKRTRSSLLSFADDNLSVSYSGNEVWKAACAFTSFSTGVHSWLVRIEKSSSPYLFVGVATRQANLDSFLGADDQSWGFIGDKALYYQRNRIRAYGETFTEGDCIGLRLDCEKGELSFSKNGVDLGVAFDNIVSSVSPAVAFYSRHQKISFVKDSCTGETNIPPTGELEDAGVEDCLIACELMANWVDKRPMRVEMAATTFEMTAEWLAGSIKHVTTRSGKSLWVDVTRGTCEKAGFYCDDKVRTPRGSGVVMGVAGGRIWVEVDNEPGAWFFHPSKLRLVASATTPSSTTPVDNLNIPPDSLNDPHLGSKVDISSPFTLSREELVEYGEHYLWTVAVDRELLSVIDDFCEVSRTSPWNLTPNQLLNVVKEKTAVLELTSFSNVLAMPQPDKMIVARLAILRFCNMYISRALPFFDLSWHYFLPDSNSLPCRLVSQCRGSLFVCVKNTLWTALMEKTANSPKKSDDEYDYPEDLPQLQVNRLKAAAAKCHEGTVSSLLSSLFGQSFEELHFLPIKTLRMVYSHPMDDGQLRSFKVKFEGEGVDDYGGPYREFFSQFFAELQMLNVPEGEDNGSTSSEYTANGGPSSTSLKVDPNVSVSACVLPFLLPSPNWRNGVGANREKFVLNGALIERQIHDKKVSCLSGESAEEKRQLYCEMFFFIGQMIGICLRTRVCVRLDLAMSVWKQLVVEDDSNPESALATLKEIDFVAYSLWKTLKGILDEFKRQNSKQEGLEERLEAMDLVFTTVLSDGRTVDLCEDGSNTAVTLNNLQEYIDSMLRARIQETQEVVNIVKQGLHSIMPVSALALLTWNELEKRMCGVAEVDVKLLQINTEYDEDLSMNDEFIQRFWRVLESLEAEDKRAFLRFVWARSRLPLGSAQFHQKFKIQALASSGNGDANGSSSGPPGGWMDSQMPKSHTCFFALQLPRYSSDEICRERLLYAVRNCVEMDGDFRLADTEMTGWTGISPTDQLRI